jgi:hypothetical protein
MRKATFPAPDATFCRGAHAAATIEIAIAGTVNVP